MKQLSLRPPQEHMAGMALGALEIPMLPMVALLPPLVTMIAGADETVKVRCPLVRRGAGRVGFGRGEGVNAPPFCPSCGRASGPTSQMWSFVLAHLLLLITAACLCHRDCAAISQRTPPPAGAAGAPALAGTASAAPAAGSPLRLRPLPHPGSAEAYAVATWPLLAGGLLCCSSLSGY